ncbi:GNAT family N-acetyltransferase [Lentzea sp. NBRC 105346]|uniref:GNAT family N-acetyltransferase n=1 Tax=Lentzea sp. NBRC 105346 TaxID=3032205 RepID=UPI0025521453|nr:GNAT family N-acetyltransferase [Lentzea sp. NBRC 105346]
MTWTVAPADSFRPALTREYLTDIIGRYYGRPATIAEVEQEMDDEVLPVYVEASWDGEPVGCLGMRIVEPGVGELTRMYVRESHRGLGGGGVLLNAVETAAVGLGITKIRLDTRNDLVEARALYARHGYLEVDPYHDKLYAEHFFVKHLAQACYMPLT